MVKLVRVDDRLLHGQIICSWVPFSSAESLVIASDEAAGDTLATEIIKSCGCKGLTVHVKKVEEALECIEGGSCIEESVMLIIGDLKDAMRVYKSGLKFAVLNIGNIHHGGRRLTPSVMVDPDDETILDEFVSLGVKLDIRDVPASASVEYVPKKKAC